jgi:nucleoside-diphosphate-sugar epimerase
MSTGRHVIFGAGQVGSLLAQMLLDRGHRVRVAKRSPGGIPPGAEAMLGDAADPAFCTTAAEGAATVYHCMNPPYSTKVWAEVVPRYMANLIAASARAGARLVVLDPDEVFGRPWMLPCRPAETLRDLGRRLEKSFGAPIALTVVPGWMRSLLSVFIPPLREMPEMQYQWEEPFVIDDRPFRERFGVLPEDADRAAAATVAWARAHYART